MPNEWASMSTHSESRFQAATRKGGECTACTPPKSVCAHPAVRAVFYYHGDDIELTNQKQKDAPIQEPKHLTLYTTGRSAALFSDLPTNQHKVGTNEQRILDVLANYRERWCSATELKEATDIASSSFHRARENLLNKRRILLKVEGRSKLYRLPAEDQQQLPQSTREPAQQAPNPAQSGRPQQALSAPAEDLPDLPAAGDNDA